MRAAQFKNYFSVDPAVVLLLRFYCNVTATLCLNSTVLVIELEYRVILGYDIAQ